MEMENVLMIVEKKTKMIIVTERVMIIVVVLMMLENFGRPMKLKLLNMSALNINLI